jgi:siroheme synthase (precorrin-2 oxidase/ferrochelatase)
MAYNAHIYRIFFSSALSREAPMGGLPDVLDRTAGTIMLIGAGEAALDTLNLLRAAGRDVRWYPNDADVAEEIVLLNAWRRGQFHVRMDDPLTADLTGVAAVVAAAGSVVDEAIARRAQASGVPVHVVGRPDLSSFGFPNDRDGPRPMIGSWGRTLLNKWLPARGHRNPPCPETP